MLLNPAVGGTSLCFLSGEILKQVQDDILRNYKYFGLVLSLQLTVHYLRYADNVSDRWKSCQRYPFCY
jgi:hypothetical protein